MSPTFELELLPARSGRAVRLAQGETLRVVNTHGTQVVDAWAFVAGDLSEFMSMEHTRAAISAIRPRVGQSLFTNRRRPILRFNADTSPGIHDTLIAACDRYRYEGLGWQGHHDSCTDNLFAAMAALGLTPPECPSPFNLWMNIPVQADGSVRWEAPVSRAGDYVELRAEVDCVVALSACPQDLVPINGADCTPVEAHYAVLRSRQD